MTRGFLLQVTADRTRTIAHWVEGEPVKSSGGGSNLGVGQNLWSRHGDAAAVVPRKLFQVASIVNFLTTPK